MEYPPLLLGGFEPLMKALTVALRRCSSSISRFLLRRSKKKTPPIMAATTMTETTTPAAIPAVLGPLFSLAGSVPVTVTGPPSLTCQLIAS